MNKDHYPALIQFIGGYFHEDFMLEFESPEAALTTFVDEEPTEKIVRSLLEVREVLAGNPSEEKAAQLLRELGLAYDPGTDGMTKLEWLRHVRSRLERVEIRPDTPTSEKH